MTWIDAVEKNGSVIQFGNEAKIIIGKNGISENLEHDLINFQIVNLKIFNLSINDIRKAVWEKLIWYFNWLIMYSNMNAKTLCDKSYSKILEGMIIEMTNALTLGKYRENAKDTLRYILDRSENFHSRKILIIIGLLN